jgi:hypothetical protein
MRMMFGSALAGLACLVIALATPAEEEVSGIGQKWLSLLDNQQYEESWNQTASMFREEVSQQRWVEVLKSSRQPLGSLVSRVPARIDFTKFLRGAPDGDYAIIHFSTSFKNKAAVTERLTLVRQDGRWQAAAYAIH